jgi:hypothetical protein
MNAINLLTSNFGGRFRNRVPFLLLLILMVGCLQAESPNSPVETGIRGLMMYGPIRPGPERAGQSNEAPLQATFFVLSGDRKVARFESNEKGYFEVLLPAGEYAIVPDKSTPIRMPQKQRKSVTVPTDGVADVTLMFDTGML